MILVAENLSKSYRRVQAADNVSLRIDVGEVFGLLGPNGAGKTTVIKMISTLTHPDSGSVVIKGFDIRAQARQARSAFAVVPQENNLDGELSVVDNLRVYASLHRVATPRAAIDRIIAEFGIADKARVPVEKLSGGQKRRVMIARVMLTQPELILLDEPTLGLDPSFRRDIWNLITRIRRQGTAILLTTHYTDEAESLCDRVAIMSKGRIIHEDTPQNLITTAGSFVLETTDSNGQRDFRLFTSQEEINRSLIDRKDIEPYTVRAAKLEDIVANVEHNH